MCNSSKKIADIDGSSNSSTAQVSEDKIPNNLYDEAMMMLSVSVLAYSFSNIVREARSDANDLQIPDEIMNEYKERRLDVRGFNDGRGLSFGQICKQFEGQMKLLESEAEFEEHEKNVINRLKSIEDKKVGDDLFLEVFDCIGEKQECVYGIFKDEMKKRIVIAFRGSTTYGEDWTMNLKAHLVKMKTPGLLRDETRQYVHVHRGFKEYLFKDDKDDNGEDKPQIYDDILEDIKPFVKSGYKIYVTGHSLGAALGSLLAFKLAGSKKDWIPKPITCITFASPFAGGQSFRDAFQQLERDGMLRYLRVTNSQDLVPTLPPIGLGGLFKHVGVRLDLASFLGKYAISYPLPGGMNRLQRMLGNTMSKPVFIWWAVYYHSLEHTEKLLVEHEKSLNKMTIDGIYRDESIVGDIAVHDKP